jgi:hypothetical protein
LETSTKFERAIGLASIRAPEHSTKMQQLTSV